jgi:hypothetical protein
MFLLIAGKFAREMPFAQDGVPIREMEKDIHSAFSDWVDGLTTYLLHVWYIYQHLP